MYSDFQSPYHGLLFFFNIKVVKKLQGMPDTEGVGTNQKLKLQLFSELLK